MRSWATCQAVEGGFIGRAQQPREARQASSLVVEGERHMPSHANMGDVGGSIVELAGRGVAAGGRGERSDEVLVCKEGIFEVAEIAGSTGRAVGHREAVRAHVEGSVLTVSMLYHFCGAQMRSRRTRL